VLIESETLTRTETIAEGVTLYLGDSREILPTLPKADALVTDPAYGVNAARDRKSEKHGWRDYAAPGWDKERTDPELVTLAVKSARHAIVWGGNYFTDALPPSSKWLSWDKGQTDFSLADFELAWCSFDGAARRIAYPRSLALQDGKEHPTQKPVEVMRWCLQKLPSGCRTVLDPFMGSGTTGVAAVKLGLQFTGIEREASYFDVACRRIRDALKQPDLFVETPAPAKQEALL
jgi:DNA modification methylase